VELNERDVLIVSIYIDDLLITGNRDKMIKEFKSKMNIEFEMTDLCEMYYFS